MPATEAASPVVASLPDQAYREIRTMIMDLRLLPGEKLVLRELAERLQMSRTPVREALVRLSSEGLVETLPHRGMRVAVPTATLTREIYQVVAGIEGQAAKLAAENADGAMVVRLEAAAAELEAAISARDLAGWAEADRVFHDLLLEASGNGHMREVMSRFDGHLHRIRMATVYQGRMPYESVRDHRVLVEAIKAKDGERARGLHLAHRDRAFAEHERIVEEMLAVFYHVSSRMHEGRLAAYVPAAGPQF